MSKDIFIIWITLFPFISLYGLYEGPKVWWLWTGGFFIAGWWLYRLYKNLPYHVYAEDTWLLAWIGVLILASVFGIHPLDSIVGGSYRHQGVLLFFALWLIILTMRFLSSHGRSVLNIMLASGVVLESVVVLVQKIGLYSARPLGTFGEPNAVAGYLAVGLYFYSRMKFKPFFKTLGYVLCIWAIVITGSRTGIAAVAILCTVNILGRFMAHHGLIRKYFMLTGTFLCLGFVSVLLFLSFSANRQASPYESRPMFWMLGTQEFTKRPLLGYGAETGEIIYDRAFLRINTRLENFMVDRSHNVFLDVALWSGVIGLFVFIGWLTAVGCTFVRTRDFHKFGALIAWVVFACFQPLGVVHWLQLVLIISI